ncbi:type II secretion system F family protein [Nocardioides sp. R-C-SC26]|uniref:type II secretion system F family protein n=1 Tax=Nocardioides sp. R-C-SC26 TaxID=2870414 RepID=UPI001E28A141|nr:type II secretion system F family protein [Nocardioides sp. R-C-SC26]
MDTVIWCGAAAAVGAALLVPAVAPRPSLPAPTAGVDVEGDWLTRYRWWWATSASMAVWTVAGGGGVGLVAALAGAVGVLVLIDRCEPRAEVEARERAARQLPVVVRLLAIALRAGCPVGESVSVVVRAYPGPAADLLAPVGARLDLGTPPETVWSGLARTRSGRAVAPLARAMARSARTGASVADTVERLADDLAERGRAEAEDRARSVGAKAAVPLGLCLLPAFVLIGIVPVVAALLAEVSVW